MYSHANIHIHNGTHIHSDICSHANTDIHNDTQARTFRTIVAHTHTRHQVEDIFTDLTIEPEAFMDGYAHKGILRSAQYIAQVDMCDEYRSSY